MTRSSSSRLPARRTRGYSLMNVLVAILVFSLGLLGLGAMYSRFTGAVTENQRAAQLAASSNALWSILFTSSSTLVTTAKTYDSSNYASDAPAELQPWLKSVFATLPPSTSSTKTAVTFTPTDDPSSATDICSATQGCKTVTVTVTWPQSSSVSALTGGAGTVSRSQSFVYQLGF